MVSVNHSPDRNKKTTTALPIMVVKTGSRPALQKFFLHFKLCAVLALGVLALGPYIYETRLCPFAVRPLASPHKTAREMCENLEPILANDNQINVLWRVSNIKRNTMSNDRGIDD